MNVIIPDNNKLKRDINTTILCDSMKLKI